MTSNISPLASVDRMYLNSPDVESEQQSKYLQNHHQTIQFTNSEYSAIAPERR